MLLHNTLDNAIKVVFGTNVLDNGKEVAIMEMGKGIGGMLVLAIVIAVAILLANWLSGKIAKA